MSTQAHHEQASLFSDDTSTRRHPGMCCRMALDWTARRSYCAGSPTRPAVTSICPTWWSSPP